MTVPSNAPGGSRRRRVVEKMLCGYKYGLGDRDAGSPPGCSRGSLDNLGQAARRACFSPDLQNGNSAELSWHCSRFPDSFKKPHGPCSSDEATVVAPSDLNTSKCRRGYRLWLPCRPPKKPILMALSGVAARSDFHPPICKAYPAPWVKGQSIGIQRNLQPFSATPKCGCPHLTYILPRAQTILRTVLRLLSKSQAFLWQYLPLWSMHKPQCQAAPVVPGPKCLPLLRWSSTSMTPEM